jgi:hypothetical protein
LLGYDMLSFNGLILDLLLNNIAFNVNEFGNNT